MVYIRLRVPQDVAAGISRRELADVVRQYYADKNASAQISNVDPQQAENGEAKTQERWVRYFNERGQLMISAPVLYKVGQHGSPALIQSLRDDFQNRWLITSTKEVYDPNTLDAKITHNFGSQIVQQAGKTIFIPVYRGVPLEKVMDDGKGVDYLRIKFDTHDSPEEIKRALAALSGKSAELVYIWTPDQAHRAFVHERDAGFGFDDNMFRVGGPHFASGGGRSRGIYVKSVKPKK